MKKFMSIAFATILCIMMVLTPINSTYAQVTADDIISAYAEESVAALNVLGVEQVAATNEEVKNKN